MNAASRRSQSLSTRLLMLLGVRPAAAQLCSLSVTPLAFGAVDVTAGAEVVSTATATVTCSGLPAQLVGVCLEVGAGARCRAARPVGLRELDGGIGHGRE